MKCRITELLQKKELRKRNSFSFHLFSYCTHAPFSSTPLRCRKAEEGLKGSAVNDSAAAAQFAKTALTEVNPRSSWRASKEFRLQLIEELAKRGLAAAVKRAGGEIDA